MSLAEAEVDCIEVGQWWSMVKGQPIILRASVAARTLYMTLLRLFCRPSRGLAGAQLVAIQVKQAVPLFDRWICFACGGYHANTSPSYSRSRNKPQDKRCLIQHSALTSAIGGICEGGQSNSKGM